MQAPDGRLWRVKRRLRWPRWRDPDIDDVWGADSPFWLGGDAFGLVGLVFGVVFLLVVGLVIVLVLPLVVFVLEALLAVAAVLAFRGTWVVEAQTMGPPPEVRAWTVRGWRRSKQAAHEVVQELRAGVPAEPASGVPDLTR